MDLLRRGGFLLCLMMCPAWLASTAWGQTRVTPPSAAPDTVRVGAWTRVTISARLLLDPSETHVPDSADLFKADAAGRLLDLVGTLNDKGISGDVAAADGVFTGVLKLQPSSSAPVVLRVAVKLRAPARRILSPVITVRATTLDVPLTARAFSVDRIVTDRATGGMVVCDELLVRFAPGATDAQMAAAVASVGGRIVGQLAGLDYFQLAVPSCDVAALRSARELLANDLSVSETSENGVRVPSQASNDPQLPEQWGLERVRAASAWNVTSPRVLIGVLDTGVNYTHEDLAGRVHFGLDRCGRVVDGVCVEDSNPFDDGGFAASGHGTAVASIAAAATANGLGMAGMAALVGSGGVSANATRVSLEAGSSDPLAAGGIRVAFDNFQVNTGTITETSTPPPLAITAIDPLSPTATAGDQLVGVFGGGFMAGQTVTVFFPSGGTGLLSGTQLLNVSNGSFTMLINFSGIRGQYGIRVNRPDGTQSNTFSFFVH